MSEKVQILFPTIERWHCLPLMLRNLAAAEKPKDCSILAVVTASDDYAEALEKGLAQIFPRKYKIVRRDSRPIDHNDIRIDRPTFSSKKLREVYATYQTVVENCDPKADYYWFIEDDTLFPLDTYSRYTHIMQAMRADIVSGISYYWHNLGAGKDPRNFWSMQGMSERTIHLKPMEHVSTGVVKLGATGLGNVLCKRKAVSHWRPRNFAHLLSGADISFYYDARTRGYLAYGISDLHLPHITIYEDGSVSVLGRMDRTLLPIVFDHLPLVDKRGRKVKKLKVLAASGLLALKLSASISSYASIMDKPRPASHLEDAIIKANQADYAGVIEGPYGEDQSQVIQDTI